MPLPDLIEIVPLDKPVRAEITVPGSKSITNRALILAALAEGEVTLEGALWSEDTQVMVEALRKLGFDVRVEADPNEFCNRTITVTGLGGKIPNAGTAEKPLELFVGNAGTAARFLSALVCLGNGVYRLHGVPRMHDRPQAALFKALRELGYRVDSPNDRLPAIIFGCSSRRESAHSSQSEMSQSRLTSAATSGGVRSCTVSIEESSQFASALLLCSRIGGWQVKVVGENAEESPYVAMTAKLIDALPNRGGKFQIEPDASSGSYFLAAGHAELMEKSEFHSEDGLRHEMKFTSRLTVQIVNWPFSSWQMDERFLEHFSEMESRTRHYAATFFGLSDSEIDEIVAESLDRDIRQVISRRDELGDSIMTAIALAPLLTEPIRFTDLGRLRVQECERVAALRTELTKCGAKVVEEGDTLTVYPSQLHGEEIETYNDHRMAMCFAILGLKVPGIKIKNPACVKKTFPNFFQKLAAPPPSGLGATILDAKTGRKLAVDELFAE
ncbi:MAG: 3-phosphoshikimate 1-carboxyvinyltransferase [Verrucomicrobia bacterium]|nr:3-phosphoshikimate 1-carboxyvinyltransferase [Verrucomicrobiota bacterium]